MFPVGGLTVAYGPGAHWYYSNTGYEILGKIAEQLAARPLGQLLGDRIFMPLGMSGSRGAIVGADRTLYAQGYEAADPVAVYVRGVSLEPGALGRRHFWRGKRRFDRRRHDAAFCVRSLTPRRAKAGLACRREQARALTAHSVVSGTPGMTYGNGLMHVGERRSGLPPSHRRHACFLVLIPCRRRERRRGVREHDNQRLCRISARGCSRGSRSMP